MDIVFDAENDRGILGDRVESLEIDVPNHYAITSGYQWIIMQDFSDNLICIGVDYGFEIDDPNKSNAMIGLVYPWAKRPVLIERLDEFDYYDMEKIKKRGQKMTIMFTMEQMLQVMVF